MDKLFNSENGGAYIVELTNEFYINYLGFSGRDKNFEIDLNLQLLGFGKQNFVAGPFMDNNKGKLWLMDNLYFTNNEDIVAFYQKAIEKKELTICGVVESSLADNIGQLIHKYMEQFKLKQFEKSEETCIDLCNSLDCIELYSHF